MKRDTNGWIRCRRDNRCKVCEKPDWCSISSDGAIVHCMRVESDWPAKSGGWFHRLDGQPQRREHTPPPQRPVSEAPEDLDRVWRPLAERFTRDARHHLARLAFQLGVKTEALERLGAGWGDLNGWCWTFPERNWEGLIVGISRRFPDGSKRSAKGSKRGLVYEPGVEDRRDGPLYIVEGASDTAALLGEGLRAIGRPSNSGGLYDLKLLIDPRDRVIVMGENDRKPHSELSEKIREKHDPQCSGCAACWPGFHGAKWLAGRLRSGSRGEISYFLPPDGIKDAREMVRRKRIPRKV